MKPFKKTQYGQPQLRQAEKLEDVINYGIWHLGKRDFSVYELQEKLGNKTDNEEWIATALTKLQEYGYLDEKRFVDNYLRECNEFKQYGPTKIKQELKQKGVDNEVIRNAMEEAEFDYFESALKCLNKKCREPIEDRKEKDKMTRFLLGRGFGFDMIRYAFEEHLKEVDENQ